MYPQLWPGLVRWSRFAQREFRNVVEHIASNSIAAASRLRARIGDAADLVTVHPLLGRVVPEFYDPSVRELIVGRHRFIYRVEGDKIMVVTVIDGSRDLRRHLTDRPWDIE